MDEILNLIESVSEGFPSYLCSRVHCWPSLATFLFCILTVVFFFIFFLARFIAAVSMVSISLVCNF